MKKLLLFIALLIFNFADCQIQNGMIVNFPFNSDIIDISSSSINATNNGCVFGLDNNSVANSAIEFNGTSSYIHYNDNVAKPDPPLSISLWLKLNSNDHTIVFASESVYNAYTGFWIDKSAVGKLAINFGDNTGIGSGNRRSFQSDVALSVGEWYHIVAIIRSYNDMEIHIDCTDTPGTYTGSGSTTIVHSTTDSRIGNYLGDNTWPNGLFLNGSIDKFAMWNRALTPAEITELCESNHPAEVDEIPESPKELVKIVDYLGRETSAVKNTPLIYMYSDGSTARIFISSFE